MGAGWTIEQWTFTHFRRRLSLWTIKLQVMRYCRNSYQEVGVEIGGGEVEGEVGGEVREV